MKTHGKSDNGSGLPNHGRKGVSFGIVGAVLLLILINGCASVSGSKDGDPWPVTRRLEAQLGGTDTL